MNYDIKLLAKRTQGKWYSILTLHGISKEYLSGGHGPCPFCGGRDRWRWDNKDNNGSGFCNQCDAKGSGFTILAKWLGLEGRANFPKLLEKVASSISYCPEVDEKPETLRKHKISIERKRRYATKIWERARPLFEDEKCEVVKYLKRRGLELPFNSKALRVSNDDFWRDGELLESFPMLICKITDASGNFMGIHRTYIFSESDYERRIFGSISGGAIQFDSAKEVLHVAEGVETSLAIRKVFPNESVWSALNAGNMARLEIPEGVLELHIWADLDRNKVGEKSAHALARRANSKGIKVFIHTPDGPIPEGHKSLDWLDVYVENMNEAAHHAR